MKDKQFVLTLTYLITVAVLTIVLFAAKILGASFHWLWILAPMISEIPIFLLMLIVELFRVTVKHND